MNGAHIHLVLNHFPIVGIVSGTIVLIFGLLLKKEQLKTIAMVIFVFSSIASIVAYFTGESAEEIVEDIAGISETLIHTHEESAEIFLTLTLILGGVSLIIILLQFFRSRFTKYILIGTLALSIASTYFAQQVGTSGGKIRHTEIRNNSDFVQFEIGDDDDD